MRLRRGRFGIHPGRAALAITLLVILTTTAVTFLLPEFYESTVRLQVKQGGGKTEELSEQPSLLATFSSEPVLHRVIEELDLNKKWAQRYTANASLTTSETYRLLKEMMRVRHPRDTGLFEARVRSVDSMEAAAIANKIGEVFCNLVQTNSSKGSATIVDPAERSSRPISPNVPLNLTAGAALGLVAGALVFAVARSLEKVL